jgi:hypothetical protein
LISSNAALFLFPEAPVFSAEQKTVQERRWAFTLQAVEGKEVGGPSGIDPGDEGEKCQHDLRPSQEIPCRWCWEFVLPMGEIETYFSFFHGSKMVQRIRYRRLTMEDPFS